MMTNDIRRFVSSPTVLVNHGKKKGRKDDARIWSAIF